MFDNKNFPTKISYYFHCALFKRIHQRSKSFNGPNVNYNYRCSNQNARYTATERTRTPGISKNWKQTQIQMSYNFHLVRWVDEHDPWRKSSIDCHVLRIVNLGSNPSWKRNSNKKGATFLPIIVIISWSSIAIILHTEDRILWVLSIHPCFSSWNANFLSGFVLFLNIVCFILKWNYRKMLTRAILEIKSFIVGIKYSAKSYLRRNEIGSIFPFENWNKVKIIGATLLHLAFGIVSLLYSIVIYLGYIYTLHISLIGWFFCVILIDTFVF